ncbi:hypothetical protein V2J09_007595 [Rumex salicifolius]
METLILNSTQRYAGCALFALALNQSQTRQFHLPTSLASLDPDPDDEEFIVLQSSNVYDHAHIWIDEHSGLLFPIFKFMEVNNQAWKGIIQTAGSSQFRDHLDAVISDENSAGTPKKTDKGISQLKSVEEVGSDDSANRDQKESSENVVNQTDKKKNLNEGVEQSVSSDSNFQDGGKPIQEGVSVSYKIKVTVLYELLSACLLSNKEGDNSSSNLRNGYDSRHRVALRLLATWLNVEWIKMEALELTIACNLMDTEESKHSKKGDTVRTNWKHGAIIGGAALAGGTLLALSGGLAAPAIAQGIGALTPTLHALVPAIGVSGLAAAVSAVGSFGGSVAVAASFGAAGAGLTGSKVAKRLGGIEEFEFKSVGDNHNQGRLAVGILVPGIVFKEEDFVSPWHGHLENLERYTAQWDSKNLIAFSVAIRDWVTSTITSQALQWGAMLTVLRALVVAVALPASLITATQVIDSNWAMAIDRSDKAGKVLAETLLEGVHGNRPVTLIGFSAGAPGLVERVVLLGAPVSIKVDEWVLARKMVAGRFVNAYSKNDWTLGIAFRAQLLSRGLAGIQPVDAVGIENVDVTDVVESHISYQWITEQILKQLELDSCNSISENKFSTPKEPSKDNISTS